MIASPEFKPSAGIEQMVLPDSRKMKPKLIFAIAQARRASLELSDKLYILENLLEEAMD